MELLWRSVAVGFCFSALLLANGTTIVYDNSTASPGGSDPLDAFGPLADSFSAPSYGSYLVDVKLRLHNNSAPSTNSGVGSVHGHQSGAAGVSAAPSAVAATITVGLYSDSSNAPGGLIATLGTLPESSLTGSAQTFDFSIHPLLSLSAGTRYWIRVSTTPGGVGEWDWSLDVSGTGVGNEFFWNNSTGSHSNMEGPYLMQLSVAQAPAAPTPVPPSMILTIIGLGAVGVLACRKLRVQPTAGGAHAGLAGPQPPDIGGRGE